MGRKEQARHLVGEVRATSSVIPRAARTIIVLRRVRGTSCNPSNQSLKFSYMEASTVKKNFQYLLKRNKKQRKKRWVN